MSKKRRKRAKNPDGPAPKPAANTTSNDWIEQDLSGRGYQLWGLSYIPKKLRIGLWIAIIALAPFYSVFQGIDLTDIGVAAVDNWMFMEGKYKTLGHHTWLSTAISALWMTVFSGLGFVSIKLGAVAISWGTAGFAYWGLRRSFGREATLAALAVTACFVNTRTLVQWINYDTLSGLFYTAGVAFLIRGLKDRNPGLIAASGFTFLLLKYVRFSSLLGLGFVAAIPLYYWLRNQDWKAMKRDLAAYGVGVLVGVLVMASIGLATGAGLVVPARHQNTILKEMTPNEQKRSKLEAKAAGYDIKFMAERMIKQYWGGAKKGVPFTLILLALGLLVAKVPRLGPFLLIGLAIAAYQWLLPKYPYSHAVNSMLFGILTLTLIGLGKRAPTQTTIVFLGLAMLVCGPAGSNTGLAKAPHTMWFALPLVLLVPFRWRLISLPGKLKLPARPCAAASLVFAAIILGGSAFLGWRNSYRDHPQRAKMNTRVNHPQLKMMYTFPERARVLQELLDNYEEHIAPDELVLTYGSAPGLHYLMQRKPYLSIAWTEQMHDRQTGKIRISGERRWKQALKEYEGAPVLVAARGNCRNAIWPLQKEKLREAAPMIRLPDDKRVYKLAWKGEFFLIYRPHGYPVAKMKP